MSRTRTLLKGIPLAVPNETLEIVMCHIHAIFARFIDSEQRGISAKMFDQCIVSVLRLGRLRRGYSQADLAAILTNLVRQERKTKKLNIDKCYIANVENGRIGLSTTRLWIWCQALDISPSEILRQATVLAHGGVSVGCDHAKYVEVCERLDLKHLGRDETNGKTDTMTLLERTVKENRKTTAT